MSKPLVPPSLPATVQLLLARSAELRGSEPIVAYYAKLQAVEQVLETKLHLEDKAVAAFAEQLLTEIEDDKKTGPLAEPGAASVLEDETASMAHVTNFVTGLFDRSQRDVERGRATRNTGSAFMATASLLPLESIWQPLSDETREKIKYSKYQAARILRAIKAGEDPNAGIRVSDDTQEDDSVGDGGTAAEEAELAALAPAASTAAIQEGTEGAAEKGDTKSDSGDLPAGDAAELSLPSVAHDLPAGDGDLSLPNTPAAEPNDLGLPMAPGGAPSVPFAYDSAPRKPSVDDFSAPSTPAKPRVPAVPAGALRDHNIDAVIDEAKVMGSAQKHAKYAISALNYEDVDTAILELQAALADLTAYRTARA